MKSKRYEEDKRKKLEEEREEKRKKELQFPPQLIGKYRIVTNMKNVLEMIQSLEQILLDEYHTKDMAPKDYPNDVIYLDVETNNNSNNIQKTDITCPKILKMNGDCR